MFGKARITPAVPNTSQAGGGAQILVTYTLEQVTTMFQTLRVLAILFIGVVQPIIAV